MYDISVTYLYRSLDIYIYEIDFMPIFDIGTEYMT